MSEEKTHKDHIIMGAFLVIIGVFLITSMATIAKILSTSIHPIELAFYRNIIVFIGFIAVLCITKKWNRIQTKRPKAHIIRATVGTLGLICGFWSVSLLPLATATTLYYTAPLLIVILSGPILREHVGLLRYIAVVIGFVGVMLVIKPDGQNLVIIGLIFAFFDALFSALTQIFLRDLGKTENTFTTVFYYMGIGSLITTCMLPFVWTGMPKPEQLLLLIGLGLTGWLQQFAKTKGYSLAPVSVTGPITYTGIIWAVFFGWLFWNHLPTLSVFAGAALIIFSNIFILWREQRRKKEKI